MDRLADWQAQIRRGLLELCVLALIEQQASYGYELVTRLSASRLAAAEGTLYPLLRRLRKDGLLEAFWQESDAGPPRQYYRLSPAGREHLQRLKAEWGDLVIGVDAFVRKGGEYGV